MAYRVTLIPGDGTGPELVAAMRRVLEATGVEFRWDVQEAGADVMHKYGTPLPEVVLDSIRANKVAIKGPITTPIGTGFRSVNVAIRKMLDLYANLRPARTLEGTRRHEGLDLVVVRENTECLYAGIEHEVIPDEATEAIRIITRRASERIVRFAFEYARANRRRKVTAVHKANILKITDGLFLRVAEQVAAAYPDIEFNDRIVDNMCMQLVQRPYEYDVLVILTYTATSRHACVGAGRGLVSRPATSVPRWLSLSLCTLGSRTLARTGEPHRDDSQRRLDAAPSGRAQVGGARRGSRGGSDR
jgi:isocitrate dehydrogenase (NAD+)